MGMVYHYVLICMNFWTATGEYQPSLTKYVLRYVFSLIFLLVSSFYGITSGFYFVLICGMRRLWWLCCFCAVSVLLRETTCFDSSFERRHIFYFFIWEWLKLLYSIFFLNPQLTGSLELGNQKFALRRNPLCGGVIDEIQFFFLVPRQVAYKKNRTWNKWIYWGNFSLLLSRDALIAEQIFHFLTYWEFPSSFLSRILNY
jgi:hypothetical protein